MLKAAEAGELRWVGIAYIDRRNVAHATWGPEYREGEPGMALSLALGATNWLNLRLGESACGGAIETEEP